MTRVIPKAPRTPTIRYVDQSAPTIPLRGLDPGRAKQILERAALRNKPDTLMPLAADATLERFVASSDESDADVTLRMTTRRELRVRKIGRRVVFATIAAALVLLAFAALRSSASSSVALLGMEHTNPRHHVGTLAIPGVLGEPVFIDDVRIGATPGPFEVGCGDRRVRIGDKGSTRVIDIPCEGRVEL